MNITCGKDVIDISRIESVRISPVTEDFLVCLEREKNGDYVSGESVFSPSLITDFKAIFVSFTDNICSRFPEPSITKADIEGQIKNAKNIGRIEDWEKLISNELSLMSSFDKDGDASVRWSFDIWNPESRSSIDTIIRAHRTISLSQIIPVLKTLIDLPKPKNVFCGILEEYSYKKIQKYIRPVYDEYMQAKKKIDLRNETKRFFMEHNAHKATLCVSFRGEDKERVYLDGYCGFDIFEKEQEIQSCLCEFHNQQQKDLKENTYNPDDYLLICKAREAMYQFPEGYENAFPGGIGFIDAVTEIFCIKENLFCRWLCPHFYLYNHETKNVQRYRFDKLDECCQEVVDFLNTVRVYSLDREQYVLNRTYYADLVAEWEINNKRRMPRRFLWI